MTLEELRNLQELIQNVDSGTASVKQGNTTRDIPLDGSLFAVSEYLNSITGSDREFYIRYVRHLQYFTGMYRLEGDKDIERLSEDILRQAIEFGKVGVSKVKGRIVPWAVITVETDVYKDTKSAKFAQLRDRYGYSPEYITEEVKGEDCAILLHNFQALPFIFFWKNVLDTIIKLKKAAVTGSIASIKKFKRNLNNNDSYINRIETQSMMDPDLPYVNNIVGPHSYETEIKRATHGDTGTQNDHASTQANEIVFENTSTETSPLWDNLKEYINFEYYQHGRRMNTNKKNERNLEGEINTEVINFELLEREFTNNLDKFCKELNDKLGVNVKWVKTTDEVDIVKGEMKPATEEKARGLFGRRKDKKDV